VLVINTWPGGAENASALVRNLSYSFKLTHAPEGWDHSLGQFANFLIDQQGRVVFHPHFNGPRDLKTADRLIAGLLRHDRPSSRGRDGVPVGTAGVAGT
jgi:hypothetical protein